jgi:alginate O-acetyltransferase complex protein AlgI
VSLSTLLIIISLALLTGIFARGKWRQWVLLVLSIFVIYWLQPSTPIRHLDYWLPTASIFLAILIWAATIPKEGISLRDNLFTGLVVIAAVLLVAVPRYLGGICCLTPSRPPELIQVLVAIILIALVVTFIIRFQPNHNGWIYVFILLILALFVFLKAEFLTYLASKGLRLLSGQPAELASGLDIRWLGFSYVAFRLLHTMQDRLTSRLPELGLREYMIYIIFFPSFTAGPIDRVQRFAANLQQPYRPTMENLFHGGRRILVGIFRKFVLADALALFALSNMNAGQVNHAGWLWLMLYAYAFRIYFDFSGYTDISLGMGYLVGIQLPENFEKPYFKQNITLFWNSWHMTLAAWFRAYIFNPLTRRLRSQPRSLPLPIIIFIGQLSTFLLIGFWHGISWNFAIWGAWHGLGLFIHNRWAEWMRKKGALNDPSPVTKRSLSIASTLLTFNYVSLGWVWFSLSTPQQAWKTLLMLFGLD